MKTKKLRWNLAWLAGLLLLIQAPVFAVETPALTPQQSGISKTTLYELNLVSKQPLPTNAMLGFIFPAEFDLAHLRMAGSSQVNGGFEVVVSGREVKIRRSGLGDEIPPNTELTFLFGNIKNPNKPGGYKIESWIDDSSGSRSAPVFYDVSITQN